MSVGGKSLKTKNKCFVEKKIDIEKSTLSVHVCNALRVCNALTIFIQIEWIELK